MSNLEKRVYIVISNDLYHRNGGDSPTEAEDAGRSTSHGVEVKMYGVFSNEDDAWKKAANLIRDFLLGHPEFVDGVNIHFSKSLSVETQDDRNLFYEGRYYDYVHSINTNLHRMMSYDLCRSFINNHYYDNFFFGVINAPIEHLTPVSSLGEESRFYNKNNKRINPSY